MNKTVVVSGGFDPLHSGHVAYLEAAVKLGNRLVVGVNSDAWLIVKKKRFFMPLKERLSVIRAMRCVDVAMSFDDSDGSALKLIEAVKSKYPEDKIVFANGGDRTASNIPEMAATDVEFVFGVGGSNKQNSSSWLLQNWQAPRTEKSWGHYSVLHEAPNVKVKELVVEPKMSLSLQRHKYRSEHWHVAEGTALVLFENTGYLLNKHGMVEIPCGEWHQLSNPSLDSVLRVIEIQYGESCDEQDIERKVVSHGVV
jgi:cytidyltransferase-like protein